MSGAVAAQRSRDEGFSAEQREATTPDTNGVHQTIDPPTEAPSTPEGQEVETDGGGHKQSEYGARRLVALVLDMDGVELFKHQGESFITVPIGDHLETYPILSPQLSDLLNHIYYQEFGRRAAPASALSDASRTLSARAKYTGREALVHRRVGAENDKLYVDLGDDDWNAVEISADGWVVAPHRVKFVRSPNMTPLPVPIPGGEIGELWRFVNAGDGPDGAARRSLILAYVAQAMLSTGPYPLLVLHGEQGSAKSFGAKILRSLVDPSKSLLRAWPASERDLIISARHSHLMAFDNLSSLSPMMSDALCRLSTGGGSSSRQLHTDYEEALTDAQRPVILTGISELPTRSDLLSRSLVIAFPRLADSTPEAELWQEFEAARPRLLGAVYTALAAGLAVVKDTVPLNNSRLADFERWAQATESGFGMPTGSFADAYSAHLAEVDHLALESSPIATAVLELLTTFRRWEGSATELHSILESRDPNLHSAARWPHSGSVLGKELTRLAPNLRKAFAIEAQFERSADRRVWTLVYTG